MQKFLKNEMLYFGAKTIESGGILAVLLWKLTIGAKYLVSMTIKQRDRFYYIFAGKSEHNTQI